MSEDKTVLEVRERAKRWMDRYDQAQALLAKHGFDDAFVVVPIDQLASMYERFLRLTKMGQATIEAWQAMPKETADLRHAIFRQSDFGAVYAGQWLPRTTRNEVREKARLARGDGE